MACELRGLPADLDEALERCFSGSIAAAAGVVIRPYHLCAQFDRRAQQYADHWSRAS